MDIVWFEDALEPVIEEVRETGTAATDKELQQSIRSVVRADQPIWKRIGEAPLTGGAPSVLWLIRLRFQFDPRGTPFIRARCRVNLDRLGDQGPFPTVYDLYPQKLMEGEPEKVSLKFGPSLKIANIELSAGDIKTDVSVGQVAPEIVGFVEGNGTKPCWDLRPDKYALEGIQTFWLLIQQPLGCNGIVLGARVTGAVQTYWGPIPVSPRYVVWDERPSIVIQ